MDHAGRKRVSDKRGAGGIVLSRKRPIAERESNRVDEKQSPRCGLSSRAQTLIYVGHLPLPSERLAPGHIRQCSDDPAVTFLPKSARCRTICSEMGCPTVLD